MAQNAQVVSMSLRGARPWRRWAIAFEHVIARSLPLATKQSPTLLKVEVASMPKGGASRNDKFLRSPPLATKGNRI